MIHRDVLDLLSPTQQMVEGEVLHALLDARKSVTLNRRGPHRYDPTRTTAIRKRFCAKIRRKFAVLKARLFDLVAKENAFGLVTNQRFASSQDQLEEFQKWLRQNLVIVLGVDDEAMWDQYIREGYKKGAARAYDDVRAKEPPTPNSTLPGYAQGSRDEFIRGELAAPESVKKAQLLASRTFSDLKGVTDQMGARMGRTLTDALVRGAGPLEAAKDLADEVDIGADRAELVARTEFIRAHAEGQLQAFKDLGVDELGVEVEFADAGDDLVCEECAALNGTVFSVDDASGVIPVHPNCRCAFVPVVPTYNILSRFDRTLNIFCKTGVGGGIDPSCKKDDAGGGPDVGRGPKGVAVDANAMIKDLRQKWPHLVDVQYDRIRKLNPEGAKNGVLKIPKGMRKANQEGIAKALGVRVIGVDYREISSRDREEAKRAAEGPRPEPQKKEPFEFVPPPGEGKLATAPIVKERELGGGMNTTQLVMFDDGTKGVWKPKSGEARGLRDSVPNGTQYIREAAASKLAAELGMRDLVPEVVIRDRGRDGVGSMHRFVEGVAPSKDFRDPFDGKRDLARASAFDYLIGNTDRHGGNWLVDTSTGKQLTLIDHGLTFPLNERELRSHLVERAVQKKLDVPNEFKQIQPEKLRAILDGAGIKGTAQDRTVKRLEVLKGAQKFGDIPTPRLGWKWKVKGW